LLGGTKDACSFVARHALSILLGVASVFLIFVWAIVPIPKQAELIEVAGPLASYSIEQDNSVLPRFRLRPPTTYVLFKLANQQGRFWNDTVHPNNVKNYFTHVGAQIHVYRSIEARYRPINGDAEKTYGISIDGKVIASLDEALVYDRVAQGFLALFGLVLLALARGRWKKENRLAA
jgi:hypothetical protein